MKTAKLFILMAALICATTAWAQTSVSTDSELRAAIQDNGANITVTADIDLSNSTLSIPEGTTVTIDLGGHTLDRKLTKRGEGGGQVITVRKGATLNLSSGTLKGGWGGDSGGISNEAGTVNLTDVIITGCTGDDRGGGISNHGTLTMTRGSITGNKTNDQTDPKGGGGIMNSKGATATLTNVTITGNTVGTYGGGGICNFGTLTLDGGTITGNKVGTHGGGIWQEGTLSMQGAMTVTGNMGPGGMTNNLFLKTNAIVTITGSLAGSTVGVNMEATAGIFTSGYSTYNSGTDPATIFTPDISDVMAVSLDGNEAKLASILPEGAVYYIECSWDSHNKKVVNTTKILSRKIGYSDTPTEGDYKLVTNSKNEDDWFQLGGYSDDNDEYYVVTGNVSNNTLNVLGKKVHLILCDGAKLTLSGGILCYGDNYKLNIHSQSYGPSMGKLIAESGYDDGVAGIGSDCVISWHESWNHNEWGHFLPDENTRIPSDIEIHGGDIYAQGSEQAAGIGGGNAQSGGNLIIYGGKITAKGGDGSSDGEGATGIGGGNLGDAGNIKIYGGTVEAWGGRTSAGIGGGEGLRSGNIEIYDGNVIAHGGEQGAGIGSGIYAQDITVTINGGIVKAYGNDGGAGIGSGKGSGMTYRSGIININGGEVYAYGSDDAAGIGGGNDVNGADVTITGGYVYAKGDGNGAGIGSGCEGIWDGGKQGGRFTMTGGEVYAYGGVDAAGIGGGEDADGGTITISGGYVYAEGNDYGSGIGGGQGGDGGNVTITGGIVIAKKGEHATSAIGSGDSDNNGTLTLGDDRCVYITSNLWRSKKENRVSDCWGAAYLQISECLHGDATASVINGDKHSISNCKWCYTTGEDTHTFRDYGECDACHLIRLEDEGNNSALFSKWNDGDVHDFLLSGRELIPHEDGSSRAYTVCLPFDMDLSDRRDDLMVYTLSYIKDGSEMVFTQSAKKIEAGKPYLIVIHKGELELLGHSKLITTASEGVRVYDWANREQPLGWWRGTLTKIESADAAAMMAYALQSVGDFRRIRPDTYWAWWGAFRSMYCPDVLPATNKFTINKATFDGFGGQTVTVTFEGDAEIPDETTGIRSIDNSQLTIDNWAGAWYDLQGRRVANGQKPKAKGLYINKGKKRVI